MSQRQQRQEDLQGLSAHEAEGLGDVLDRLETPEGPGPDDKFWHQLHHQIMAQVEVTPLPRPVAEAPRSGFWAGLVGLWRRPAFWAAVATAAVVAFFVTVGGELFENEPSLPDLADRDAGSRDHIAHQETPIRLPDTLWEDGFLQNRSIDADEEVLLAWEDADEESGDEEGEDDEGAGLDIDGSADPWGIGDLSEEELRELEAQLAGG